MTHPLLAKAIAEFPARKFSNVTGHTQTATYGAGEIHTVLAKLFEDAVRECVRIVKAEETSFRECGDRIHAAGYSREIALHHEDAYREVAVLILELLEP